MIKSRDVLALTGLSADQLREWTVRRGLISPDVPAQKRGSGAKFNWRTVLLLRLAMVLRSRFHVELQAHRKLLSGAREILERESFPGLWGGTLAIYDFRRCELLSARAVPATAKEDAILLRLDQHLEILSRGLDLPAAVSRQSSLFPAVAVQRAKAPNVSRGGRS